MAHKDEIANLDESITAWIGQVQQVGNESAAEGLYGAYFSRLTELAGAKLNRFKHNPVAGGEDIAIEVFASAVRRLANGKLDENYDRIDLWHILLKILTCKCADFVKRETAQKRGGGQVVGVGGDADRFGDVRDKQMSPETEAAIVDEIDHLVSQLNPQQRTILELRYEGRSNQEIAEFLNVSVRSVERKMEQIREKWEQRNQ